MTEPTANSMWCHECGTHAEPKGTDLLPEGWGWVQRPDWVTYPYSGATGPFYACPECREDWPTPPQQPNKEGSHA
jgi:hypothetical protein